jgi:hypothetical protein
MTLPASIAGAMITDVLEGPLERVSAQERGPSTTPWVYGDVILLLDSGHVLELGPTTCAVLATVPAGASPQRIAPEVRAGCVGVRICDVLRQLEGEGAVLVLLASGHFLENASLAWGTNAILTSAEELDADELQGSYVGMVKETTQSLTAHVSACRAGV